MRASSRPPFVAVNCAELSRELAGNELFGHRKGVYTGAVHDAAGLFLLAKGGTLFLDEIADLDLGVQAMLLRALGGGGYRRLGGTAVEMPDARLIAATNRDLFAMVAQGQFRPELLARIAACVIVVPSVAERREDLLDLFQAAAAHVAAEWGLPWREITEQDVARFAGETWEMNLRAIQHAAADLLNPEGASYERFKALTAGLCAVDLEKNRGGGGRHLRRRIGFLVPDPLAPSGDR